MPQGIYPRKEIELICKEDKKPFKAKRKNALYCSAKCKSKAYNRQRREQRGLLRAKKPFKERKCARKECKNRFIPRFKWQKFCSDKCQTQVAKARYRTKYRPKARTLGECSCPKCGKKGRVVEAQMPTKTKGTRIRYSVYHAKICYLGDTKPKSIQ